MALFRRPNSPFWWASFTGPDGKRAWESTGLTGKRPAAEWLEKKKLDVLRRRAEMEDRKRLGLNAHEVTVGEVAEKIKQEHFPLVLKRPSYVKTETQRLDYIVRWFGADTLVSEIRRDRISTFKAELIEKGVTYKGPLAEGGANAYLVRLSHLLRQAEEWEMVEHAAKVRKFPKRIQDVHLTRDHVDRLVVFCRRDAPGMADPLLFAATTGCRAGELERLLWGDVDLKRGTILFRDTKNSSDRMIGMLPECRALLERLQSAQPVPVPAGAHVFVGEREGKWLLSNYRAQFNRAVSASGIPAGTVFHHVRHMFANWARLQGWPYETTKRWMGHRTDEAASYYRHVEVQELLDAAAGKFDRKVAKLCDTGVTLARQAT